MALRDHDHLVHRHCWRYYRSWFYNSDHYSLVKRRLPCRLCRKMGLQWAPVGWELSPPKWF
jgi:hypothetical protein